jgi:predicted Zn-dependent peptidase
MIARALAAAATLAVAAVLACAPVAAAQESGALPQGGSYVSAPDPTLGTASVGLWYRAPSDGYGPVSQPGLMRIAATAAGSSKLVSGRSLSETVRDLGGRLYIEVFPDIVGVHAVVPAASARRVAAAMTAAYFAPAIDADALKSAQRDAAVLSVEQRYSPDETLHDLLFAQIFSGRPASVSPVPAGVPAITAIQLDAVTAFAKRAFRSSNALLVLTGNVDSSVLSAVTDGTGPGAMDAPVNSTLAGSPAPLTNATGAVTGLGLAWTGPPISDERSATALDFVSDYLFRDDTGVVSRALESDDATFVDGQFVTLHDAGVMFVTISGKNTDAARKIVDAELSKMQTPLDARQFNAAREAFLYHLAGQTETPLEQGENLGWYSSEGNAAYAPFSSGATYLQAARSLDPEFVASVVRRYLARPVVVQLGTVKPPKGSTS